MSKFKRTIEFFGPRKSNFLFYYNTGSYGMYCDQIRRYWFCVPFLFGIMYEVSW
jgi:hypothetical protein